MNVVERLGVIVIILMGVSIERSQGGEFLNMINAPVKQNEPDSFCPRQYVDVLAECPSELECTSNDSCSENDICCSNACGSKSCVSPSIPKDQEDTASNNACTNHTCTSQGRECKAVHGKAYCSCILECDEQTTNEDYVCDQNGQLYMSLCKLDKYACESGNALTATRCRPVEGDANFEEGETQPPGFTSSPGIIVATERSDITMDCQPWGNPRPSVFWQTKDGITLLALGMESGALSVHAESGQLTINDVQLSDNGAYTCIAVNRAGRAEITYRLVVRPAEGTTPRTSRSPQIECHSFPSEQARRCESNSGSRRIKRLWVYNRNRNACTKSFFRDCGAVTNKVSLFPTKARCEETCVKEVKGVCQLPPRQGRCQNFQQRFFYDARTRTCKPFIYSGCSGNMNNFPNVYECRARCFRRPGIAIVGPPQIRCRLCAKQGARAVCDNEFVLTGIVTHLPNNAGSGGQTKRVMHLRILKVLQDRSQSLNLFSRNLNNLQEAKFEINLDLDHECPCPDIRRLMHAPRSRNFPSSRRQAEPMVEMKAIVMGSTVNGVPTIDSNGYADRYSDLAFDRISSAVAMEELCSTIRLVDDEHLT